MLSTSPLTLTEASFVLPLAAAPSWYPSLLDPEWDLRACTLCPPSRGPQSRIALGEQGGCERPFTCAQLCCSRSTFGFLALNI